MSDAITLNIFAGRQPLCMIANPFKIRRLYTLGQILRRSASPTYVLRISAGIGPHELWIPRTVSARNIE